MNIWYFLVHWTGSDYGAPYGHFVPYDFLSGVFGGSAFLTAAWTMARKHNCHARWCLRLGRHEYYDERTGLTHNLCRKHHPDHPGSKSMTAEQITNRVD